MISQNKHPNRKKTKPDLPRRKWKNAPIAAFTMPRATRIAATDKSPIGVRADLIECRAFAGCSTLDQGLRILLGIPGSIADEYCCNAI